MPAKLLIYRAPCTLCCNKFEKTWRQINPVVLSDYLSFGVECHQGRPSEVVGSISSSSSNEFKGLEGFPSKPFFVE